MTATIVQKLKQLSIVGSIVVMPDFFVDRIIRLESKERLLQMLSEKAQRGGGSVRGISTADVKGGNAVNTAYALAKLGAKVTLFTVADEVGAAILRQAFAKFGDKVDLHILPGKHGLTTSFEFLQDNSLVNVMVSDIQDNADFGPMRLSAEKDRAALEAADGVIVVNWASNMKGTELAEFAFKHSPAAFHMIDPADIEARKDEFRDSLARLSTVTDCLSINENECDLLAESMGLGDLLGSSYGPNENKHAAKTLAEKLGMSVDLHTKAGAAWSNGKEIAFAHSVKVEAKTITGAGDVWDAADMLGHLTGLEPEERLLFANCCASLFVRDPKGEPPDMNRAFELVERVQ
jgi:ribokinase